jgi:DNA-binding MarR family transcriptional regulator
MATQPNLDNPADIRRTVDDVDPVDVLETELALLQRALERLARRSDIHRDLDRASYLLARTLDASGPISVTDLASRLGLDATTVTRQVAAMERLGLLHRHSDPSDGRVTLTKLAPKGRRAMSAVHQARRERVRHIFAGWPGRDQVEFGQLLGRFNDAVVDRELRSPHDSGSKARRAPQTGPSVGASGRRRRT